MRILLPFLCSLLVVTTLAQAAEVRIEAEGTTDSEAIADGWAWGGKAVQNRNSWQPLLRAVPPASAPSGDVHIWLRHRHGPVNFKVIEGGNQVELGWSWASSDDFQWAHFGPIPATRLAGGMLFIRDAGKNLAQVDCVVLSDSDKAPADPPMVAREGLEELRVSWPSTGPATTGLSFGLNLTHGYSVSHQSNPKYQAGLKAMRPGFVRLLDGGINGASTTDNGLYDLATKRLDPVKVATMCTYWKGLAPDMMINLSGWPAWMDANTDGFLDADQIQAFAASCAELVRLVNISGKVGVHWWEPTNERDEAYWKDGRHAELAQIHIACAAAMKAVDPTIKVGGPAAARPDHRDDIAAFVKVAGSSLDFLSWHAYACGTASESDANVFARARIIAKEGAMLQQQCAALVAPRELPGFFNEYNISWTWETRDPRMTDQFSAVFDALVMTESVNNGVTSTAAWNECDGVYGKMDLGWNLRPSSQVFTIANREMIGQLGVVEAGLTAPAVLAITRPNGSRALMLTNTETRPVRIRLTGMPKATISVSTLSSGTLTTRTLDWSLATELPGRSVTWMIEGKVSGR